MNEDALAPSLTIVGRLPELTPHILPDVSRRIVRDLALVDATSRATTAIVIDIRDVSIDSVERWLAEGHVDPQVPIVLVSVFDDDLPPNVERKIADVVLLPTSESTLRRRLRLALSFAATRSTVDFLARTLQDQRTFDHAILDGVEVGIITTDFGGCITFANRRAKELLQIEGDVTDFDVTGVLGLSRSPAALLGGDMRRLFAYQLVTREGVELDLELALTRGDSAEDSRVGFFLIFRDVREDKEREAEHRRFERLAAMGTMVAGFAHEVRNPVAALRSLAEELGEELTAAGIHLPHAQRMLVLLGRMERLVRTSLQFGRPAAPRRAAHRPWTICSAAISTISARTLKSGEAVRIEVEPELPDVFVDDAQIAQALVVLLDNALDAASSPRGVLLRVSRDRATDACAVRFEVIDDGAGIAAADLSHIFDPFFTTKATGTGLGLSIAQQIVSENGGRIEVSAMRGAPTCFAVIVTCRPGSNAENESP